MDENDPYGFLIELCEVSFKQENLLRGCPFVGDNANSHRDEPSPTSGGMQVASAGIVMASLSETQGDGKDNSGPQDVFHTLPEESWLPTSDDQPKSPAVYHCTVNQMVEFDEETMGFVDFGGYEEGTATVDVGTDSELGFSEVVAECSRRPGGAAVSKTYYCELNKVPVLERELSLKDDLGELPLKMLKVSEQNLALYSSMACLGADPLQKNVVVSKELPMGVTNEGNACGESSAEKSLGSGENLGTQVVQPEIARSAGNFSFHDRDVEKCVPRTGEVNETSERQNRTDEQPGERVPPSIFDVLNVLGGDPEDDSLAKVSLVKIAKSRGMTFPYPRWWPEKSG